MQTITIREFVQQNYGMRIALGECRVFYGFDEIESAEISPDGYTTLTEKANASGGRGVYGGLPVETELTVKEVNSA